MSGVLTFLLALVMLCKLSAVQLSYRQANAVLVAPVRFIHFHPLQAHLYDAGGEQQAALVSVPATPPMYQEHRLADLTRISAIL